MTYQELKDFSEITNVEIKETTLLEGVRRLITYQHEDFIYNYRLECEFGEDKFDLFYGMVTNTNTLSTRQNFKRFINFELLVEKTLRTHKNGY